MKKIHSLIAFILVLFLFCGCKKETTSTAKNPVTPPITNFDNSSQGMYKGVFIGSSGTIIIKIHDGDSLVTAYLDIDGIIDTLRSTTPYMNGQAVTNMVFQGAMSSMIFSVDSTGANPNIVQINIDGHSSVTGAVVHVLTTQDVYCYEGTFAGDDQGTFNCIRFGDNIIGMGKSNHSSTTGTGNATVTGNSFVVGTASNGATFSGTFVSSLSGCSGTWTSGTSTGTFTAVRTL